MFLKKKENPRNRPIRAGRAIRYGTELEGQIRISLSDQAFFLFQLLACARPNQLGVIWREDSFIYRGKDVRTPLPQPLLRSRLCTLYSVDMYVHCKHIQFWRLRDVQFLENGACMSREEILESYLSVLWGWGEETGLITIIIMNIPIRLMCVTS